MTFEHSNFGVNLNIFHYKHMKLGPLSYITRYVCLVTRYMCKPIIVVDLHCSFTNAWQLAYESHVGRVCIVEVKLKISLYDFLLAMYISYLHVYPFVRKHLRTLFA